MKEYEELASRLESEATSPDHEKAAATIRKLSRELLDARLAATHNAECAEGLSRELEEAKEQWIAYQGPFERAGWELTKLKGELEAARARHIIDTDHIQAQARVIEEARGERDAANRRADRIAIHTDKHHRGNREMTARVEVLEALIPAAEAVRAMVIGECGPSIWEGGDGERMDMALDAARALSTPTPPEGAEEES